MTAIDSHMRPIALPKACELIASVNESLAAALAKLALQERHASRRVPLQQDIYLARYPFGHSVIGSHKSAAHMGGFMPPCPPSGACNSCKEIFKKHGTERPLCVVLTHAAEEFLEDRTEHFSGSHLVRFSSSRLVSAGEYINLAETLNSVIDPEFPKGSFKAPVRNVSAGIRSVYLAVPTGNKDLKLALKKSWKKVLEKEPHPEWWDADWQDRDLLKAASDIGLAKMRSSWELRTVVISAEWLRSSLYARGTVRNEGKDILLQLLASGWKESRGLRSTSIRQLTLLEAARGLPGHVTAEQIVGRLLLILRGDAPGFRPALLSDETFPMAAIWQTLIGDEQIQKRFFPDRFPGIIEPFHLNRRTGIQKGAFFYYPLTSFEHLGNTGSPVDELDTIEGVDKLLRTLQNKNPEMLGQIKWDFFASPAPLESKHPARSATRRTRNILVPFMSAELSYVIHKDFEPQLRAASNFGPVPTQILSKPPRKGFLRRFIRVEVI